MDVTGLRETWRVHIGAAGPPVRTAEILRRELAWRLMVRVHGDLSARLKRRLDVLARQSERGEPIVSPTAPTIGATLVKIWNGQTFQVIVLETGFLFEGKTYRSLTEIARVITGVHRSGPKFFGLAVGSKR